MLIWISIDYNDQKVLDSIGTGKNDGVFQLESAGMKSFMKELKAPQPGGYYRRYFPVPSGPHGFYSPVYQRERMIRQSITYDCPQLEPILKPTYGCIVYQEQVMQIVRDLAGYTLGQKRSAAAGHVQEERRRYEEGASELCVRR